MGYKYRIEISNTLQGVEISMLDILLQNVENINILEKSILKIACNLMKLIDKYFSARYNLIVEFFLN